MSASSVLFYTYSRRHTRTDGRTQESMRTKRSYPDITCHVNYNLNEVFTYKVNDGISRYNVYIH